MCPYGTYVLLGSLKHVLRVCNTWWKMLLRSLKSMVSMYNNAIWMVMMSLSCVGVSEIASFTRLMLWTWLMSSFLGSWKNCVLAECCSAQNPGHAELAACDELTKCMWWVFLLIFTKKVQISLFREILKFVSEGSLPWRFLVMSIEGSLPWRFKCCWIPMWGSWNE